MNREMEIIRAVALKADSFYEQAREMAEGALRAVRGSRGKSQMKNLENIANSTMKVSDVFDYIKKQVARYDEWQSNNFGVGLLRFLQENLRRDTDNLIAGLEWTPDEIEKQKIYLLLIREFVRQMVIHYEYGQVISGEIR
jgi:hypothetical protein